MVARFVDSGAGALSPVPCALATPVPCALAAPVPCSLAAPVPCALAGTRREGAGTNDVDEA